MPKSPTQIRQAIRQAQQRAIDNYNRDARKHNQKVQKAVDDHNRQVRQAVNTYNRGVREHNARVRANQQRIKSELAKLSRQSSTVRYTVYRSSVQTLHESYTQLDRRSEAQSSSPAYNRVLDLAEREVANSLSVTNALLGDDTAEEASDDLQDAALTDELLRILPNLDDRWQGAVFALNPRNRDAARHFCTSAREVLTGILEIKAPDRDVLAVFPDEIISLKNPIPTRRAKIRFFLHRKGMLNDALEDFVEQNMQNILELFKTFNEGTHGTAGVFSLHQLSKIKKRVEDSIMFLAQVVH